MKNIQTTLLKTQQELKLYQELANKYIGVHFPLSYLNQGDVRAFYMDGVLVGGYALITQGPFRTISSIPDDQKLENLDEDKIFEVTALWLTPSLNSGLLSLLFWLNFSRDVFRQKSKTHFVYAYDVKSIKLKRLYALAHPKVLYQGEVKKLEGNKYAGQESIEIASRKRLGFLPLYGFKALFIKLIFTRKTYLSDLSFFKKLGMR